MSDLYRFFLRELIRLTPAAANWMGSEWSKTTWRDVEHGCYFCRVGDPAVQRETQGIRETVHDHPKCPLSHEMRDDCVRHGVFPCLDSDDFKARFEISKR